MMTDVLAISADEFVARRAQLIAYLRDRDATGFVLFDEWYIQYFTGFWFLATERPVAVAGSVEGDIVFVPEFEVERVRAESSFERVESYPEYPGIEPPMRLLARVLRDAGIGNRIGADSDGYPGILGYEGPALSEVSGVIVLPLSSAIERMMRRKSAAEVELIRASGRWCSYAHRLLQQYSVAGATEAEASLKAGYEATLAMVHELGERFGGQKGSSDGATAGYRGQIGPRSSWAHAIAHNIEIRSGDVLVSETSAPIWGYKAELERTMVVGPPGDDVKRLFDHMLGARQVAFDTVRPGATCADVDGAVMRYLEENDLLPYWRQHTGHGIGLRNHESPFLDLGDDTVLESGMVFTIEPGLYDPNVGGFRHSDTVVVRDEGMEILTDYPRDLESLVVP